MKIFGTVGEKDFVWWHIWGILGLTVGNLQVLRIAIAPYDGALVIGGIIFLINTLLFYNVLTYSKFAFLITTILAGPIAWIINGIYLINRWCHPKLNGGKPCGKYLQAEIEKETVEKFKENVH